MPKVTGPDGIEREISTEEFMEALAGADPQNISIQQIVTDTSTGEEVERYDIPVGPDGSFDLFGGGLFGSLFADNRDLEEKIEDAEDGDEDTIDELAMLYLNGDESKGIVWKHGVNGKPRRQKRPAKQYRKNFVSRPSKRKRIWTLQRHT